MVTVITQNGVLQKDDNGYPVMGGTSSLDDSTIINSAFDPVTRRLLVDSGDVSGQVITPTGTVNGSNTVFTVPAGTIITSVVVDGLERYSGFGYTYSDPTITIDPLAPPVEYIRVNTASVTSAGQVQSIVAGANVTVDSTDPANPIVSATASAVTLEYLIASSTAPAATQAIANYVCDGVADDVQINAALTALALASPNGGRVTLSEGTFNIAASIVMKDFQVISGQGYGTILKATSSFNSDIITTVQTSDTTRRGLQVLSLKIDGNRDNNTSGRGIYGFNVRNSTFRDLWITECDEECIYMNGGASEIGFLNLVEGCQFDESDLGIHFVKCEHNIIQDNFFSHIDGVAAGSYSDMDFYYNNFFDDIGGFGIYLDFGAGQWKIRGNSFERMASHVIVARGTPYTTITDNYIEVSTNMVGIYNGEFSSGTDGCNYMVCMGNTFHKRDGTATGTSGIVEADFTDRCIYSNNFLYEMATPISLNASSTNVIEINNQT